MSRAEARRSAILSAAIQHLWPLTNEAVANTYFADLDAVEQALADRRCALANDPERLKAAIWFHWWPQFA
ncbi:MAG TPA: hypothetical protein VD978_27285 [Azospirillum sp.]|nr:hypothetical protein [Azospirillum sp.]